MKHKFFRIPPHGGEPEQELNQFLSTARVLAVDKQFVDARNESFWAVCVQYVDGATEAPGRRKPGRVDYKEVLTEEEFAVFAKLRELRKTFSNREGAPVYAIFTNDQLAAMIRNRARTKADLAAIDGVGPARVEKYGTAVIEVLRRLDGWAESSPEPEGA
jgi:superfamily II DNA helicase RecQ